MLCLFFCFKQKTAYEMRISDWSSDVCSSDLGELAVGVEPDLPRSLTYAVMRPWRPVEDTIVYNEGLLLDAVAQAIINRRLEARARGGGSFLYRKSVV